MSNNSFWPVFWMNFTKRPHEAVVKPLMFLFFISSARITVKKDFLLILILEKTLQA